MRLFTPIKFGLIILSTLVLVCLVEFIRPEQYCPAGLKRSLKRLPIGWLLFYHDNEYDYDEYDYFDLSGGPRTGWEIQRHHCRMDKRIENLQYRINLASEKEQRRIDELVRNGDYQTLGSGMYMTTDYGSRSIYLVNGRITSIGQQSPFDAIINGHSVRMESTRGHLSYRVTSKRLVVKEGSDVGWAWLSGWCSWGLGSEEVTAVITWWGWWKVEADGITVMIKPMEASMKYRFRAYKTGVHPVLILERNYTHRVGNSRMVWLVIDDG